MDIGAPSESARSRPGLTSLIRTGRGLMTLQTEIVGQPARLVTIVDFRGRVLKRWESSFFVDPEASNGPARARSWHGEIEARVRESLTRASQARPRTDTTAEVVAHMFVAAMRAYAERDFDTARELLAVCDELLPHDERIAAALRRLRKP